VNCSMVRNWKVCQPEHKEHVHLYPLGPQTISVHCQTAQLMFEYAQSWTCWNYRARHTYIGLFVFYTRKIEIAKFSTSSNGWLPILAAAWEIPPKQKRHYYGVWELDHPMKKSVISYKLRWQLIKGACYDSSWNFLEHVVHLWLGELVE
jgi:hypothetical protein